MIDIDDLKEYFEFLDKLRESGQTNMFSASRFLYQKFSTRVDFTIQDSDRVLILWMETFDSTSVESRVKEASK